jgi:glycosyltransferase involved in cell wall biosynthesis
MIGLLGRSHLVVCPSLSDNGPNAVIEAILVGVPVILSDMCGSGASLPVHFRNVVPVPKWWRGDTTGNTPELLATAILDYYERVFLRREVAGLGEAVRASYEPARQLGSLYETYREVYQC